MGHGSLGPNPWLFSSWVLGSKSLAVFFMGPGPSPWLFPFLRSLWVQERRAKFSAMLAREAGPYQRAQPSTSLGPGKDVQDEEEYRRSLKTYLIVCQHDVLLDSHVQHCRPSPVMSITDERSNIRNH